MEHDRDSARHRGFPCAASPAAIRVLTRKRPQRATLAPQTARDRKLRMFDPRAGGDAVRTVDGHGGIKGSRVVWAGDRDRIITTGVRGRGELGVVCRPTRGDRASAVFENV